MNRPTILQSVAAVLAFLALANVGSVARAQSVNVCCTIPDFGSLVREIGGNQVTVTVFAKATEDPHFLEARPSFVKAANQADLLVHAGMQLELGWLPAVLQGARNANVLPGGRGNVDCSTVIQPLEVPQGRVDRAMGDVHPGGNPHYWTDPLSGLKVAALIRDKLAELRPDQKSYFNDQYDAFAKRVSVLMIGEALAKEYDSEDVRKLALLFQHGKLGGFLKEQDQDKLLGGWFGMLSPYYGTKIVDDHSMWPYFARTFGLKVVAHMEPKPGIGPTTQHLGEVVAMMKRDNVRVILASAYYDPRHARFLASQTGAAVVNAANLAGARPGTENYLAAVDYNVRELVKALQAGQPSK
jgi:ABC-type Zn uptake system ZnuABC Zn-binding protein ZnuA